MQLYAVCNSGRVSRALFGKSSSPLPDFLLSHHNYNLYVALEDVLIAIWTKHASSVEVTSGGTPDCLPDQFTSERQVHNFATWLPRLAEGL
jgi:hypothetical protein